MNQSLEKSLFHLTGHRDIGDVSVAELEKLTNQYPFFPVAQLLLSKKLKADDDSRFHSQLQKTALYFNNPYWLHYQFVDNQPGLIISTKEQEEIKQEPHAQEDTKVSIGETEQSPNTVLHNVSHTELQKASKLAKETLSNNQVVALRDEDKIAAEVPLADHSFDHSIAEEIPTTIEINDAVVQTSTATVAETSEEELPPVPDQFHPEPEFIQEELDEEESVGAELPVEATETSGNVDDGIVKVEPGQQVNDSIDVNDVDTQVKSPDELAEQTETSDDQEEFVATESPKAVSVSEEELAEDETLLQEIAHPSETLEEISNVQTQESQFGGEIGDEEFSEGEDSITISLDDHDVFQKAMKEKNQRLSSGFDSPYVGNDIIPIEPYHTIDYFASQGIKLALEKNPTDKLGKNLRSFTDWLKHMKKLGPEDSLETSVNDKQESFIQGIADNSNIQRDIVTQTMAEVLERQGKKEKAIQLYIKLSFLNPDKSAYFADKIQKLKGI